MTAELLEMMPAIGYETVMGFTWAELKVWHKAALDVYKNLRGWK
jgi:hypothetical protein